MRLCYSAQSSFGFARGGNADLLTVKPLIGCSPPREPLNYATTMPLLEQHMISTKPKNRVNFNVVVKPSELYQSPINHQNAKTNPPQLLKTTTNSVQATQAQLR